MMYDELLIIFVKYPEKGKVKTRLAKRIGNRKAVKFYTNMLKYLSMEHKNKGYKVVAAYTPKGKKYFTALFGHVFLQDGGDLGKRMTGAIKRGLKESKKVVIIGSDIPDLDEKLVKKAFRDLDRHDIVLGPSYDGGYYLIGMKKFHDVFSGIKWSTRNVLRRTIQKSCEQRLLFALLRKMRDVDS